MLEEFIVRGKGEAYANIELVPSKIPTSVCGLDNHLLSSHGTTCEGQLVASTAPACFRSSGDVDRCVTVGQVVTDCPWGLVGALIGGSTTAARGSVGVENWLVLGIAHLYRSGSSGEVELSGPCTRWFAAVPISRGDSRAGGSSICLEEEGEEGEEGLC